MVKLVPLDLVGFCRYQGSFIEFGRIFISISSLPDALDFFLQRWEVNPMSVYQVEEFPFFIFKGGCLLGDGEPGVIFLKISGLRIFRFLGLLEQIRGREKRSKNGWIVAPGYVYVSVLSSRESSL